MNIIKQTGKEYFKALRIIHLVLVAGVVFFLLVLLLLDYLQSGGFGLEDLGEIFFYLAFIFSLGAIFLGNVFFGKKIAAIKMKMDLKQKLEDYRKALIVRLALLEAPAFFCCVAFMLTGQWIFVGVALFNLAILVALHPSKERAELEMDLSFQERQRLKDPKEVVCEVGK